MVRVTYLHKYLLCKRQPQRKQICVTGKVPDQKGYYSAIVVLKVWEFIVGPTKFFFEITILPVNCGILFHSNY